MSLSLLLLQLPKSERVKSNSISSRDVSELPQITQKSVMPKIDHTVPFKNHLLSRFFILATFGLNFQSLDFFLAFFYCFLFVCNLNINKCNVTCCSRASEVVHTDCIYSWLAPDVFKIVKSELPALQSRLSGGNIGKMTKKKKKRIGLYLVIITILEPASNRLDS